MTQNSIILIGGGNMGGAMATRWQATHTLHIVERDEVRRAALTAEGFTCHATLAEAPAAATYILAIKPQQFAGFTSELSTVFADDAPLLISIMAGIPLAELQAVTPNAVRVMPNLAALIGESMSVLCAPGLDAPARANAEQLFAAIGAVAWVTEEEQLHAVTGISGSGPAYLFALMEALETAAVTQGLSPELARKLVTTTMRGSALLADASVDSAGELCRQVTSKGGTTEAALHVFAGGGLGRLVGDAVSAAVARSKQLAEK